MQWSLPVLWPDTLVTGVCAAWLRSTPVSQHCLMCSVLRSWSPEPEPTDIIVRRKEVIWAVLLTHKIHQILECQVMSSVHDQETQTMWLCLTRHHQWSCPTTTKHLITQHCCQSWAGWQCGDILVVTTAPAGLVSGIDPTTAFPPLPPWSFPWFLSSRRVYYIQLMILSLVATLLLCWKHKLM